MPSTNKKPPTYRHTRLFPENARWTAGDLVGELLANGTTAISIQLVDREWRVEWLSGVPQNELKLAKKLQ